MENVHRLLQRNASGSSHIIKNPMHAWWHITRTKKNKKDIKLKQTNLDP